MKNQGYFITIDTHSIFVHLIIKVNESTFLSGRILGELNVKHFLHECYCQGFTGSPLAGGVGQKELFQRFCETTKAESNDPAFVGL